MFVPSPCPSFLVFNTNILSRHLLWKLHHCSTLHADESIKTMLDLYPTILPRPVTADMSRCVALSFSQNTANGLLCVVMTGAEVPDLDNDVGTGKEGDVEARCFRTSSPPIQHLPLIRSPLCGRTRLPAGPMGRHVLHLDRRRPTPNSSHQKPVRPSPLVCGVAR